MEVEYFETLDLALQSKNVTKRPGGGYSSMLQVKTTKKQDQTAIDVISKRWDNAGYRLLWRNCSNLVFDALIAAGQIESVPLFPGPNERARQLTKMLSKPPANAQWWKLDANNKWTKTAGVPIGASKLTKFGESIVREIGFAKDQLARTGKSVAKEIKGVFDKLVDK